MPDFLKKKPKASFFLVLVLSLQFFFLPFYHLHPDDLHGHEGELSPHEHEGHVHSHEVESIAHFLDFHGEEQEADEDHHHPHSSSEHDSDFFEVNLNKTTLYPKKTFQLNKDSAVIRVLNISEPSFINFLPQKASLKFNNNLPGPPKGRSPPLILL